MAEASSLHRHSTPGSIKEIPPSPIADSPASTRSSYFPSSSSQKSSLTSSLGLSGHGPVWWLSRVQRYSSYTFSAFMTAHLVNTALIPLATKSVPASETYLLLTRPYYQSLLFEPLIVTLPLIAHIGAGLALRLHRRRTQLRSSGAETRSERKSVPWPKVSGTSALGFALTSFVVPHAFVNRVWPLVKEGGSSGVGLGFVAHGFARQPALAWAIYTAMVGLAGWHVAWGWAKWLGLESGAGDAVERGLRRKRVWYGANAVAAALAAVWAAGGVGVVGRGGAAGGWKGREWDALFSSLPVIGSWFHVG